MFVQQHIAPNHPASNQLCFANYVQCRTSGVYALHDSPLVTPSVVAIKRSLLFGKSCSPTLPASDRSPEICKMIASLVKVPSAVLFPCTGETISVVDKSAASVPICLILVPLLVPFSVD